MDLAHDEATERKRSAIDAVLDTSTSRAPEHAGGNAVAALEQAPLLVAPGERAVGHQMRSDEFFALLRPALEQACDAELVRVQRTAKDCPYISAWLAYYASMPPAHVERAIAQYTGGTAATATELAMRVVRQAVVATKRWVATGELAGIPGGVDATRPPGALSGNPVSRLGPGAPLAGSARSVMESVLGTTFADVRVHTDHTADAAAREQGAQAFAVGNHIAFAGGKFQPGTDEGDAMIAHELAHVAQQQGASGAVAAEDPALERDADEAVLAAALGGARKPRRAFGLSLQRCPEKSEDKPTPTPSPTPAPPVCTKPPITVHKTGHMIFKGVSVPSVQPTDMAQELACELFELRDAQTDAGHTYPAGTRVRPKDWDNTTTTVRVMVDGTSAELDVPKTNLRPVGTSAPHVAHYDTALDAEAKKVKKEETDIADWRAKESTFKKNHAFWQSELDQKTQQLAHDRGVLNEQLIQQTMYNRFDDVIQKVVDDANRDHGVSGADALDPNIVKAMIFEETELGTSGPFLDDVAGSDQVKNHYNLTQAIDSSGQMYALYFLKNQPALVSKYHLSDIIHDLHVKQARLDVLKKKPHRSTAEDTEKAELDRKSEPRGNWETFFYEYPGLWAAMNEFWAASSPPKNKTYDHWIEMMVFELFEKKKITKSTWAVAVRAYNGSGNDAERYSKRVVERAKLAGEAAAKRTPFIPTRDNKK